MITTMYILSTIWITSTIIRVYPAYSNEFWTFIEREVSDDIEGKIIWHRENKLAA